VWDTAPDPLAQQLVRHIERMCEAHAANSKAVKTLRGIIVDGILGEHVKFIKKKLKTAVEDRQTVEHSITYEEHFSTLTIVAASDPAAIRRCLGGMYFEYMERILAEADMDHRNTVHWIFAWGEPNVAVHMLFLPKRSALSGLPTILPIDLLTTQEKSQVGL